MIGTVIDTAFVAGLEPVVVVTGFRADEVEAVLPEDVRVVRNPDPGRGNMSSLLVGIQEAGDIDALVILLSDMPDVSSGSIEAVCAALAATEADFAWTQYTDGRGHPIAISADGAVVVRELRGTKALWPFFDSLDATTTVQVPAHFDRPVDVNTMDDYDIVTGRCDDGDTLAR
jgi:CTP:molybdopterin cytidylyltransferase MocA